MADIMVCKTVSTYKSDIVICEDFIWKKSIKIFNVINFIHCKTQLYLMLTINLLNYTLHAWSTCYGGIQDDGECLWIGNIVNYQFKHWSEQIHLMPTVHIQWEASEV